MINLIICILPNILLICISISNVLIMNRGVREDTAGIKLNSVRNTKAVLALYQQTLVTAH